MKRATAIAALFLPLLIHSANATWEVTRFTAPQAGSVRGSADDVLIAGYPDNQVVALGEGYDFFLGQRRAVQCVSFNGTQRVYFRNKDASMSEVVDEESLWRKLNTSISARAKFGGWGGGASYSSTIETKTTSKNITFVVKASLKQYAETLGKGSLVHRGFFSSQGTLPQDRIDLTEEARELLEKDPGNFQAVCGDGFVMQITYGADMYGIFEFNGLTFNERRDLVQKLDVSGAGGMFSADASSSLSTELKSKKDKTSIRYIEFGAASTTLPATQAELAENYKTLGTRAEGKERPMFLTVVRYTSLPSAKLSSAVDKVSQIDVLVRRLLRFKTLLKDLDDAIAERIVMLRGTLAENERQYVFFEGIDAKRRTLDGLMTTKSELESITEELRKRIDECIRTKDKECNLKNVGSQFDAGNYEDLAYRALMPLQRNGISDDDYNQIKQRSESNSQQTKNEAACYLSSIIAYHNVRRVNAIRAKTDGESVAENDLKVAESQVYQGFNVPEADCAPILGTKGLGTNSMKLR